MLAPKSSLPTNQVTRRSKPLLCPIPYQSNYLTEVTSTCLNWTEDGGIICNHGNQITLIDSTFQIMQQRATGIRFLNYVDEVENGYLIMPWYKSKSFLQLLTKEIMAVAGKAFAHMAGQPGCHFSKTKHHVMVANSTLPAG